MLNVKNQIQLAPEPDSADIHDRVTEAYYGLMGQQFMRETQDRIHWICRQIQGKSVLDVGCSQGIVPILLAREGLKVIGIDSSPKAIDEANQYLANEPEQIRRHVSFVNSDFLSWNYDDLKIDTVVMSEVLEHLTRPEWFLEAAARILAERGRLIVTVPFGVNDFIDHKHTFYLLKPLRLIAKHFDLVDIEILGKWLGIVADRRVGSDRVTETFHPTIALIEKLESAFYQTERVLRDELSLTRKIQDKTNQTYQGASEQITALKQRVTQEEAARRATEQALREATTQLEQLNAELAPVRSRLEESNQNYQGVTEQVTALKQRVTQEEAARQATEQALREATTQLEQTQRCFQEERTALQQQLAQWNAEGQTKTVAVYEAEKTRLRLEAELAPVRSRLETANQNYQCATELVTALKQRVAQEEAARQVAEQALRETTTQLEQTLSFLQEERITLQQQLSQWSAEGQAKTVAANEAETKLIRLEAELVSVRSRLEEANGKYRGASEQITALKQRVTQEETARQATEQALRKATTQQEQMDAGLASVRSRLEEANGKYRAASEQVTALKQRVTQQEEAARQAAAQALAQAAAQREQMDAGLASVRSRLEEANGKYRGASEQVTALKQRVTQQEEAARQAAEQTLREATGRLEEAQRSFEEERTALQQQLAQKSQQEQAASAAAQEAEKTRLRLEAELASVRSRLEEANGKYRGASEQVTALKQRVTQQEEAARQAAEQALAQATAQQEQMDAELASVRSRLEEANGKYRGASEQVTALKQRVTQQEEAARQAAEQALAQATAQQEQMDAELASVRSRLEEANGKYRGASEQVTALKQRVTQQEEAARQAADKRWPRPPRSRNRWTPSWRRCAAGWRRPTGSTGAPANRSLH